MMTKAGLDFFQIFEQGSLAQLRKLWDLFGETLEY